MAVSQDCPVADMPAARSGKVNVCLSPASWQHVSRETSSGLSGAEKGL
ncbi:MAG: hypothetical protein VW870_02355 [Rhodobiaceae bacterium]